MKETIIDGVNVCECRYYDNGNCYSKDCIFIKCVKNNNCIYRQLQRLQEENEKLRDVTSDAIIEQEQLIAKVNKLRESLEEIRNHCVNYARTESYVIDETFNDFLGIIFSKINEVLK